MYTDTATGDVVEFKLNDEYMGGYHIIYEFSNGYGASVVTGRFIHGMELAVLKQEPDGTWPICYDTPITSDVMPGLDTDDLQQILNDIRSLPKP